MNIQNLADRLEAAARAYYSGTPIISDAEYDALEDLLRSKDPVNPVFAKVGAPVGSAWSKVRHSTHGVDMGSLNKAQTPEDFSEWFLKISASPFCWSEKLDGISVLLVYVNGKFTKALTRGDGEIGEDITRNVSIMKGVPHQIEDQGRLFVRGEIVCLKSDHATHFPDESNPRNTASGKAKTQSNWRRAQHLTVMAYNLTYSDRPEVRSRFDELTVLQGLGFKTPNFGFFPTLQDVENLRDNYSKTIRQGLDYDIDGLVIEINDTKARLAMGSHNLRPKGAIAYKFDHDMKPSVLRNVIWQVGQTGRVTPVAVFDPVLLAGAQVKQASLYNVRSISDLLTDAGAKREEFREGDAILVSRRNDVIPRVEAVLSPDGTGRAILTPTNCPECDSDLERDGEYLVCRNDDCPAQVVGSMRRWISKLGILHFGEHIINAVAEAGLARDIADLYRLDPEKVSKLTVDGRRIGESAKKAIHNLHEAKSIEIHTFVGSLGINMIGSTNAKLLVDAGINTIKKMKNATLAELCAVPGFGQIRAEAFQSGIRERAGLIDQILGAGVIIIQPTEIEVKGSAMVGQAVCMTGFRDDSLEKLFVSQGGVVKSSVSRDLTYLVCKSKDSSSAKYQKAQALGVEILSVEEFRILLSR